MSPLENVPPEIFDVILAGLKLESDIYHLLLTCKEMHDACIESLYRVNAANVIDHRSNQPYDQPRWSALDWALENGMETIALRVINMTPEVCDIDHVGKAIKMKDPFIADRLLDLPHVQLQLQNASTYKVDMFTCDAIAHGHIKCLDILETLVPINLGKRDYLSNYVGPSLALACKRGYVNLVKKFAAAGLRKCSSPGVWLKPLPLVNAIRYRGAGGKSKKNYEMAKILLDIYPKLAVDGRLLFAAAQEGHESVLGLLIKHGAPKPDQETLCFLLFEAIRGGCLTFIQRLLENGASIVPTTRQRIKYPRFIPPKDRAHKALQNAGKISEVLASQRKSLSSQDGRGQYVLSEAISADNIPLVRYCISVGAHRIKHRLKRRQAVLSYRVSSIDMLECLTTEGININLWDEDGNLPIQNTLPLLSHCIDDPLLFFKAFVSKVGDINARNSQGQTVLSYCCAVVPTKRSKDEYRYIKECVEALLDNGAKLDLASATGRSPLHEAAQFSSEEVVSLLLKRGANPNALDNQGCSPLHSAMTHREREIVVKMAKRLLEHGADPNHRDRSGTSALHIPPLCVYPNYAKRLLHLYLSSQEIKVEGNRTDDNDNETDDREGETQDGEANKSIKSLTGDFLWRRNSEGTTPSVVIVRDYDNNAQEWMRFYHTDRGFDVPDAHGITPLAAAFLSCRTYLARSLVYLGADINWVNDRDQTVLDILSEHSAANRGNRLSMSQDVARELGGLTSRELANCRETQYLRVLLGGNGPENDNVIAWGAYLRHR